MFTVFKKSAEKKKIEDKKREAEQKKLSLRLAQITQSSCRRGLYDHVNCSPYSPCFDTCPIYSVISSETSKTDDSNS